MTENIIYALDFDGVICDSAVETGITGWKAAARIWDDMQEAMPQAHLIEQFRTVRPVLETGYEAILIMRLLHQGLDEQALMANYSASMEKALADSASDIDSLKRLFGQTRDQWIDRDLDEWVAMNPLFDGVTEKLQRLARSAQWYIVTTKQERFVSRILAANDIELSDDRIFGLDRKMSKVEVLTGLTEQHPGAELHFVEDRLPTLEHVLATEQLAHVHLYLVDWGYNTVADRQKAAALALKIIAMDAFLQ